MAYQFNFKGLNKEPFLITMPDSKVLTILPPKNKEFRAISGFSEKSDPYEVVLAILNLNANGVKYEYGYVTEQFDVMDIVSLIEEFGKYLQSLTNQKN